MAASLQVEVDMLSSVQLKGFKCIRVKSPLKNLYPAG